MFDPHISRERPISTGEGGGAPPVDAESGGMSSGCMIAMGVGCIGAVLLLVFVGFGAFFMLL